MNNALIAGTLVLLTLSTARGANRKRDDVSAGRNIATASAETVEGGTVTVSNYELVFMGLTYGVTDNLQLSTTTLLPIFQGMPLTLLATAKYRAVATKHFILSVQSGAFVAPGLSSLGVGVHADFIFDRKGTIVVSAGAQGALLREGDRGMGSRGARFESVLLLNAAFSAVLARHAKILLEVLLPASGMLAGQTQFYAEGTMLNYGVRFFGSGIAVDLTFLRPISVEEFPLGIPFVAASARF